MKPPASSTLNDGARHHPHTLSTLVYSCALFFPCEKKKKNNIP